MIIRFLKRVIYIFLKFIVNGMVQDIILICVLILRLLGIIKCDYSTIFICYLMARMQVVIYVTGKLEDMHRGQAIKITKEQMDKIGSILEKKQ